MSVALKEKVAPKGRKRTRLSPADRRRQLVQIGMLLFAERGLSDVWVDDVAEAAGVSRGLIYHYFPTKRDFYIAVLDHAIEEFLEQTAPDPKLIGVERVHQGVEAFFEYVDKHRSGYLAVTFAANSGEPEVREMIERMRERSVDRICHSIVGDAEVPEILRIAVKGYQGSMIAICTDWIQQQPALAREQLIELAYAMFIGSLGAVAHASPELEAMLLEAAQSKQG
jgi:AcrR family transcriptional regulator